VTTPHLTEHPAASQQAIVDAALLMLRQMGLSPDDLVTASRRICVSRTSRTSRSSGPGWFSTRNSAVTGLSGTDDLLDQREVIEVRPEGPDLPLAEVGHRDAGQLDVPSCCFQHASLV